MNGASTVEKILSSQGYAAHKLLDLAGFLGDHGDAYI